ncbi:MAG: hypothetical protein PWQ55_2849 [Chloroflexota bacterium]|nr:hypothetical protein [Chloroflexota bacterium]
MIPLPAFDATLPAGITAILLDEHDQADITALLRACDDFSLLVSGQPSQPEEALDLLRNLPPGSRNRDKRVYGFKREAELIGVLDAVRGYPHAGVCFIGLFLLHPQARGRGLGFTLVDRFARSAQQAGYEELMLGVVEENRNGLHFWKACGFNLLETLPARTFGRKQHRVLRMHKILQI